ncbi:MAG TPA: DsbA family oxidoreductase [Cytophagaceae bacterium]|jgi:predicted DsbA family dithiol-disulfide isomerase
MANQVIKIDIVSDIVCPWCYIGKRRLEKAMSMLKDTYTFEIKYLPFELNGNVPKEGLNQKEYLTSKFGGEERYTQITGNVTQAAKEEGLNFDFDKQPKSPNTLDIHRIIWLAEKEGKDLAAMEIYFKAYFDDGVDLTKNENLVSLAERAGVNGGRVKELLEGEEGLAEVKALQKKVRFMGITGVPYYIINEKYAISGAQPAEAFAEAIPNIAFESLQEGEACDIDGSNC